MKIFLPSPTATTKLGQKLGEILSPGTILLLRGELGAGKTSFVQGIGQGLGITEAIVSPTFTLVSEYSEGRIPLYHLDLYRLGEREVENLYLENYYFGLEVPLGITAIEWSERLPVKPPSYLDIELVYSPEQGRFARLEPQGNFCLDTRALAVLGAEFTVRS
jgi:tRNA threonylcarbamoyladenosine biosynthesis protein TsaE